MNERQRYAEGMQVRREVLGDVHVDQALSDQTAFNEEFQDLITRYAWGEIWSRPGLPRHTRSLVTAGDDDRARPQGGISPPSACRRPQSGCARRD